MGRYASKTTVGTDRTRGEIEKVLDRYGADQFVYGRDDSRSMALIGFRYQGVQIRLELTLPGRQDREFTVTQQGRDRSEEAARKSWEQACRQRWRALLLVIKAKLEAVETGITTFEKEFMAFLVLPNGRTVGEFVGPQIKDAYLTGDMPPLLPWKGESE